MKSKKALFAFLDEYYAGTDRYPENHFKTLGLKAPGVQNETYGKDSHIYLFKQCQTKGERYILEKALIKAGFKVHRSYWPESNAVDIQVSYFKGWHWDE